MKFGNKVTDYDGPRDPDVILNYLLTNTIDNENDSDVEPQKYGQCGGGKKHKKSKRMSQNEYKLKYAKYKAKYFKLLSNMQL
jgi:hypothetical protein